ncbi:uncharacterized protein A4U43_C01F22310 [Asparagus officinalis]|uniref:Uncharacterized protein n=1 Tax=Asparagus officinalis TaxID=4686 RepID=A0A5P1FS33_ASPOF|nr:uncharacterized protein A4U43_C01F22310 [Asparagus officinalis]
MAPRAKASSVKKIGDDASSSALTPDRDPEPKPSDLVLAQLEELKDAVKRVISLVDQGHGTFAELKQSLSDRVARLRCHGDFMLGVRCSMWLIDLGLLLMKLEDLRHADLESKVKLFLALVRRHAAW